MKINTIEAVFVREEKHRFMGIITINEKEFNCYIPSSSKLKNYFEVNNRPALVIPIDNPKSKTKYRLIAICDEDEWITVDLNILNHILKEKYEREGYIVELEKNVTAKYRTDLIVKKDDLVRIIEVKGILSLDLETVFPLNCGERANRQLMSISEILNDQICEVEYAFVMLSSAVNKITINNKYREFKENFEKCLNSGMNIRIYYIDVQKNEINIFEKCDIEIKI